MERQESNNARKKRERIARAQEKKQARQDEHQTNLVEARAKQQAALQLLPEDERQRLTELREELKTTRNARKRTRKDQIAGRMSQAAAHFAVDLNFEHMMNHKEVKSIGTQVLTMYGENCGSSFPFQLHLVGLVPGSATEAALDRATAINKWEHITTHSSPDIPAVFPDKRIIYLSPDADDVLDRIEPDAVYVVGGLVDRNKQNNASIDRANGLGVCAQRLPIAEYAEVSRTDFFTISDVLKILSMFGECADWASVFGSLSAAQRNARRVAAGSTRAAAAEVEADEQPEPASSE